MNTVDIAMITDDNYVIPTAVAIYSLIENKKPSSTYHIYIITSDVSEENCNFLKSLSSESIHIMTIQPELDLDEIISENKDISILSASRAALYKFMLGLILKDLNKILYIDSDTIIKDDLSCLFNTSLNELPLAAIPDSGQIYYKHAVVKLVKKYFNSGIMIVNCKKFREDKLHSKLIKTKNKTKNSLLMDQDAFNIVFDENYLPLPIKYNFLTTNLNRAKEKYKVEDINKLYRTSYASLDEINFDATILHYASKDKPWKRNLGELGASWYNLSNALELNKISKINPVKIIIINSTIGDSISTTDRLRSMVKKIEKNTAIIFVPTEISDNLWDIQNNITTTNKQVCFLYLENQKKQTITDYILNQLDVKNILFTESDTLLKDKNYLAL